MRCKEFVKILKQEMKCEKVKEHRKKVQERKQKNTSGIKGIIHQLTEDTSTNKAVAFHTLKAIAAKGKGSFTQLSKNEFHFICHLFAIKFKKSETKDKLDLLLIDKINNASEIIYPDKCTKQELKIITESNKCTLCHNQRDILGTLSISNPTNHSQSSANPGADAHSSFLLATQEIPEPQLKARRKQFRPDDTQKAILQQDHLSGITKELVEKRASEFGFDATQIRSWHRRFKQKQNS